MHTLSSLLSEPGTPIRDLFDHFSPGRQMRLADWLTFCKNEQVDEDRDAAIAAFVSIVVASSHPYDIFLTQRASFAGGSAVRATTQPVSPGAHGRSSPSIRDDADLSFMSWAREQALSPIQFHALVLSQFNRAAMPKPFAAILEEGESSMSVTTVPYDDTPMTIPVVALRAL